MPLSIGTTSVNFLCISSIVHNTFVRVYMFLGCFGVVILIKTVCEDYVITGTWSIFVTVKLFHFTLLYFTIWNRFIICMTSLYNHCLRFQLQLKNS